MTASLRQISSYPPYSGPSHAPNPTAPSRSLLPLLPPPESKSRSVPTRPFLPSPPSGFLRSFHAIPAAYPRLYRESTGSLRRTSNPFLVARPGKNEDRVGRQLRLEEEAAKCITMRCGAHEWTIEEAIKEKPHGLWLAAERWRRTQSTGGVTLVLTHANGLPKEHWHPVLQAVVNAETNSNGFGSLKPSSMQCKSVDDIWFLDDVHHGVSVDLNEGLLGPVHSWADGGRDVLNFIQHVLPTLEKDQSAPEQLSWQKHGLTPNVVGVGHSFGGNALVQAAHARPDCFSALFLVEPMCLPLSVPRRMLDSEPASQFFYSLTLGAIKRRHVWNSTAEAASMRSSPFFSRWDETIFSLWLSHGLVPTDRKDYDGPIQLSTPSWCEAAVFSEPTGLGEGWDKLPQIDVPIGFLMAGDASVTNGEAIAREMVWRPKSSLNERVMDSGHLIVQEKPLHVADALSRFMGTIDTLTMTNDPKSKL